ncbi:Predicted ATP-dependent endonuclease of the OLD family, contains P-loop ATPase and TOPRIM domains [Chryseobacterium rhizoplanae]|uniref:Predicted ATP-dependent endonuclease of the OLD family, contains P-loop ATPase and TOPRIM domains n=1 Tax=Chryseobacterium rhizoplanae TaxID=1609531 RepID=A0A521B4F0_9FLAO|nr:AAA family ATPase [Chryseobacterium rhizoplanae]SMO41972.1 Predicted ATP-dependent endonuclease of the OLD family, contains P-loop ATPase and TOPRIM domains [Chryseobacterium rhizoplanae]
MYISGLSIRNFRNFKSAHFKFTEGINTIIGENGSGKTNLFYALRILIDDSLPRYINFNSNDFNRGIGNWAGHWIVITVFFEGLDASEEAQALAVQSSGCMDTPSKGSYSVYFRPKYQFRKELYDYSILAEKDSEGLELLLDKITIADYEVVYLSRGSGDFSDDVTYEKYVGNFDKIKFPDPDEKEELVIGTYLPREISIHNEVSCTFIKALRDVEADLRSYSNNPLINLLKGKEKTVEITKQDEIITSIDNLNEKISSLDEVIEIKNGIDKSIKNAVGTTYAPSIDIKSELPNKMEKLFQSLKLWVGDPEDDYKGRVWELSLGGANLIYLSLKLLEYERVKTDRIANFLLIEEPEAHIHTHIQKTLFNNLSKSNTQIIISTHSTHISSASKISSVNVICRGKNEALVFQPSNNLLPNQIRRLERYLDAVRSNLLFAKGVILVEGDAEQILIPAMFEVVFGLSLDEIGVSLINIGSTGFENVANIFHEERIKKYCAILTDQDISVVKLPDSPENDTPNQKHFRASQKSGEERRVIITELCKDNEYLEAFYATHTFEVDLLMNENSPEFVSALDKIYRKESNIKLITKRLENPNIQVAGLEVLRLAKKYGKGWFALLITDELLYNTYIPNYILKAIAFASPHINLSSKVKSIMYRIEKIKNDKYCKTYYNAAKKFETKDKTDLEILEAFIKTFPQDQLTKFLSYL